MSTSKPKIQHVSASQFKTFSMCRRKWFIEKCTDAPKPEPSKAILLGTEVHSVLERLLRDGIYPDEENMSRADTIAEAGFHLLPDEGATLSIEKKIRLECIEPPLIGFIDVMDESDPARPVIADHKTTSSWKWAKTEEQLRTDPQMIAYARHALDEFPSADTVEVAHIQYLTKGSPAARRVSALLDREHVDQQWQELVALAAEMKETSCLSEVEEVEPTLSACGAFGGCPYADTCAALGDKQSPFAGIQELKTKTKEDEMTRLEELLQRRKSMKKAAPPILSRDSAPRTETAEKPAPRGTDETPPPAPKKKEETGFTETVPRDDRFSDEKYSEAANQLLAFMRNRDVRSISNVTARPIVGRVLSLGRVRPYYVEKACHMSEGTLTYSDGKVLRGGKGGMVKKVADVRPAPPVAPKVEPPAPKAPAPKVEPPAPKAKVAKAPAAPKVETSSSLVVYVDCLPTKRHPNSSAPQSFEDVLAPHIEVVSRNNKVSTPLLMPYGEGKNQVAGLLRVKPPTGCVTVTSDNPYWPACKTVIIQSADVVVTGIK